MRTAKTLIWADLSLRWAHMPFCWFCHNAAQMMMPRIALQRSPLWHELELFPVSWWMISIYSMCKLNCRSDLITWLFKTQKQIWLKGSDAHYFHHLSCTCRFWHFQIHCTMRTLLQKLLCKGKSNGFPVKQSLFCGDAYHFAWRHQIIKDALDLTATFRNRQNCRKWNGHR